jgi:hypothetical protein
MGRDSGIHFSEHTLLDLIGIGHGLLNVVYVATCIGNMGGRFYPVPPSFDISLLHKALGFQKLRFNQMCFIDSFSISWLISCMITSRPRDKKIVVHPWPTSPAPTQATLLISIRLPFV